MTNYAYLRVSTERQDVENQKLGMLEYYSRRGIAPLTFVEDTASRTFAWCAQAIGRLLDQAQAGDVLVAAEVSRSARSTL
jgi:DNA invertase Pin-like site-specific DNA recombinase